MTHPTHTRDPEAEERSGSLASERRRILAAYARRDACGRDRGAYFGLEDEAHLLRLQERHRWSLHLLREAGLGDLAPRRALDVGCGDGYGLLELVQWGAEPDRLAGIDLRPEPVATARRRLPGADLRCGCASSLPWADGRFDLVVLSTVLSSILDDGLRLRVAAEAARVTSPAGAVLVYDTRRTNPSNPDVRPVGEAEILGLFPGCTARGRTLTFLPHRARRMPRRLLALTYPLLVAVPAWRSHRLVLLRREWA